MIVLYENHIEQTDAVIASASDFYGLLFEQTHSGSCLTGIEHACFQSVEAALIFVSHGCHTAHALHDVEHYTLGLQQRAHTALNHKSHITGLYMRAVGNADSHFQLGVEFFKHLAGHFYSGQDSLLFHNELLAAHFIRRDS